MKTGKHYIHRCVTPKSFKDGQWTYATENRDVILMATCRGYAMVRRPRCAPYVCMVNDLHPA